VPVVWNREHEIASASLKQEVAVAVARYERSPTIFGTAPCLMNDEVDAFQNGEGAFDPGEKRYAP
jgi:hypothetical protein